MKGFDTMANSKKKQKLIGIQEYINPNTGECIPMQVVSVEERDFNFHKIWLQNMVMSLSGITNKKIELAFWIIENVNRENQLIMTFREISKKTGLSLCTVRDTMKALQEGDMPFLVKLTSGGAYQINPQVIWKGSHGSRMGIIYDFNEAKENNSLLKETAKVGDDNNANTLHQKATTTSKVH